MENINLNEIMNMLNTLKNKGVDLNQLNENMIKHALMTKTIDNPKISTKMNWLVNSLLSGIDDRTELVKMVNENMKKQNYGILRAPTGIGKSGIIYSDIYNRIVSNSVVNNKKQIFIISTPLLCLNDQFFNDMISTLYGANLINNKNCVIANNSCDIELKKGTFEISLSDNGICDTKIPMMSIDDACLELQREEIKIALVVSTHKSFNKMSFSLNAIKTKIDNIEIGAYMDEEHTIKFNLDTNAVNIDEIDEEQTDGVIDINSFKNVFNFLYLASATPREDHLEMIRNIYSLDNPFVADIGAKDAIVSKDILPTHATFCTVNDKKNDNEIEEIIKHIFEENTDVEKETHVPFVKILIGCETTENLKKLRDHLVNKNYKVFYTTAATGKHFVDSNGDIEYNSISEFTTSINNIQENVVVLHIRQVIAGVDISGLTHCIIRGVLHGPNDVIRAIQTIGRTLRYFSNERIKIKNDSNYNLSKKFGSVYFVTNNDSDMNENLAAYERFMYVNYNVSISKCFDLKDHKITGNHRLERLNTDSFTKNPKTTGVNVAYIDFFMNQDIVQELIKQKVDDDYNIIDIIESLNEDFKVQFENDGFYTTEYMSIIKGYTNKLDEVLKSIKNAMNQ